LSIPDCIEELAPAAVVRAALFPIRMLTDLADREITELADELATRSPSFDLAYEASMRRQREALGRVTIEDPQFARALCITNEDLSRRLATQRSCLGESNKRGRRLEATLYRYLARAVWRTEPCDLWAGVGIAVWGDESSTDAVPTRYAVSPDLRPYQFIVQALAETERYIERGVFKLNPTLTFDTELQRWRYTVRSFSSIISRERPPSPGLDALLDVLANLEPATLEDIAAAARRHGVEHEALDRLIWALEGLGLLVGGLAFPRRYSSAWDALFAASRELNDEHAALWRSSVIRLRRVCRRLEQHMETIAVVELHDALREVRGIPLALARALDVPDPALPRSLLRCDASLPFSIVLGGRTKERLTHAAAEYDEYERRHGLDAAIRTAHRVRLLNHVSAVSSTSGGEAGRIQTQESAWLAAGADDLVGRRLEQLSRRLEAQVHGGVFETEGSGTDVVLPPIGALVLRPANDRYQIIGTTTEITAAYGRYGELWSGFAGRSRRRFDGHPLHEWYQATLGKAARDAGIDIVEYVGPCEAMPNLLARPEFQFAVWDRWGTASSYRADQMLVDLVDDIAVALVARDGDPRRISLTCFSPANVGFSEPHLERLLLSSFREVPPWLGHALPMERELTLHRPSPPLTLPSGNTVEPRRTFVHDAALASLVAASPPERYILWRALARRHAWPPLVLVGVDGQPSLPVVRDSPLAVEVALRGIGNRTCIVSVEEPGDHTWPVGEKGEGHVFEFIVPFLRRRHAWSALGPSQPGAPEQRDGWCGSVASGQ
jgi:hypothetical protein